ncbi:hypothetical protein C474_19699 [Halogeometricum pallidum JCM 14848]|uniref:Uncharacterized protein n=1 Tax=Halogeometricum pallidum JCM 14848 TaxID=1227487 RepID=M0CT65_HALPD|nr:hypothetical protein [Halogeometricum pallidum]ELZ26406.1 hypothetical protein C474_19699 [Halogeometricum pallidum JCM 14848]
MTDTDENEDTMATVSHTHPHTDETFGGVYRRGPAVADGGEVEARAENEMDMDTVDHTPREGDGAEGVWTRGSGDVDE